MAFGRGALKGMRITMRRFIDTYRTGLIKQPSAAGDLPAPGEAKADKLPAGMPDHVGGLMTTQYPDQRLPTPERFRYIPFLLFDEEADNERAKFDGIRCTACGICAKVCPPQCIWIVQGKGEDGKPRPVSSEFYIDASICMSCGFCAEYCPFDAIKMNHDYEFSSYERHESWVFDMQELLQPVAFHAALHPSDHAREVEEARAKEEALAKKAAAKAEAGNDADAEAAKAAKAEARKKFLEARAKKKAEQEAAEAAGEDE